MACVSRVGVSIGESAHGRFGKDTVDCIAPRHGSGLELQASAIACGTGCAHQSCDSLESAMESLRVALDTSPARPSQLVARIALLLNSNWRAGAVKEEPDDVRSGQTLLTRLVEAELPTVLVENLPSLEFEVQKHAVRLFSEVLRCAPEMECERLLMDHISTRPGLVQSLLHGCGLPEALMPSALILRECARSEEIADLLLHNGVAESLVDLAQSQDCDVSFEAFESLRELLLGQPVASAAYLAPSTEEFFLNFNKLLENKTDKGYASRRQALKLLGDILLHPAFGEVMRTYVARARFLQVHMNVLRDSSRLIQIGAFHIFKIFVANPFKPRSVARILAQNKVRLAKLLRSLLDDAAKDEALYSDLTVVIGTLQAMDSPASSE